MIDVTDLPRCEHPGCDDGWILGYDENWLPCPDCEREQDAMRAELNRDLDAMHAAREDELMRGGYDPQAAHGIAEREMVPF